MNQKPTIKTALPAGCCGPLKEGTVTSDRVLFDHRDVHPINTAYRQMVRELAYDVSLMSPTSFLVARSVGIPIVALPVFTNRRFHHAVCVSREESGIEGPRDIEGRKVGVNAWTITTGMWGRAILSEEYGVNLGRVDWVAFDEPHVKQYTAPSSVTRAPEGKTMVGMLVTGEIDAAIGMEFETGLGQVPGIRHLIPDIEAQTASYYQRTGIYPIMNLVCAKEETLAAHPWLAEELLNLFNRSKTIYLERLRENGPQTIDEARLAAHESLVGSDPLPFGISANRLTIEAWVRSVHDQGIIPRRFEAEELFPSSLVE